MVTTERAECLFIDNQSGMIVRQFELSDQPVRLLSHPAIVYQRLFIVVGNELRCD